MFLPSAVLAGNPWGSLFSGQTVLPDMGSPPEKYTKISATTQQNQ